MAADCVVSRMLPSTKVNEFRLTRLIITSLGDTEQASAAFQETEAAR